MRHDLTRFVLLRGLGAMWFVTFLIWWNQAPLLVGEHGLTPLRLFLDDVTQEFGGDALTRLPTVFWLDPSDLAITAVGAVGTVLGAAVMFGLTNAAAQIVLWLLYVSIMNAGQDWYGYGWELLMCDLGFLSIFLCPLTSWSPRGLAPVSAIPVWMFRWLVFRVLLGAGLIKLRGDPCWRELTCLIWHYETQPNPQPLSWYFHHLPHWVNEGGVAYNHVVELVAPWFVFGPKWPRRIAAVLMTLFQLLLIASGNLAFFNWLTLILGLALLDDAVFDRLFPRLRGWLAPQEIERPGPLRGLRKITVGLAVLLIAWRSAPVVRNLFFSDHQAMNRGYDPLHLVNTYGAFGSVGQTREEAVIQGTTDDPTDPDAKWIDYEFPCKPGDPMRRPCFITPYHLHLDWQMWFVPLQGLDDHPWVANLLAKLLQNDPLARSAFVDPPFADTPPRAVRLARFEYHFTDWGEPGWWTRTAEGNYVRSLTLDDPALVRILHKHGWDGSR